MRALGPNSGRHMVVGWCTVAAVARKPTGRGKRTHAVLTALGRCAGEMSERMLRAAAGGHVLRYVGTLDRGKASAGLKEFPRSHPIASAKGSDNVIAFTTKRYSRTPLVVQGPGAGADVTAMGVFSDILKLLHYLPR